MLKAFEYWFGKYPLYEDGYKLIAVSYPGMEHQSSVTYGNYFQKRLSRTRRERTGIGFKFDFIIVHESATSGSATTSRCAMRRICGYMKDLQTMPRTCLSNITWANKARSDYVIGSRKNIGNDEPIIGTYGANREGSGDMYYKGGNMLHTIRQIVNDDEKWRSILTWPAKRLSGTDGDDAAGRVLHLGTRRDRSQQGI